MSKSISFLKTALKVAGIAMFAFGGFVAFNICLYSFTADENIDPVEKFGDIEGLNFGENYVSNVITLELPVQVESNQHDL